MQDKRQLGSYGMSVFMMWREAWRNLMVTGKSTLLALSGIAIGCASVVAFVNTGHNATLAALKMFSGLDINVITTNFYSYYHGVDSKSIKMDDLKTAVPGLSSAAPWIYYSSPVRYNGKTESFILIGASAELEDVMQLQMRHGRFISDYDQRAPYLVIGNEVAATLGEGDAAKILGKQVQIGNYLYTVIGVFDIKGQNPIFPFSLDSVVVVPIDAMRKISSSTKLNGIISRTSKTDTLETNAKNLSAFFKSKFPAVETEVRIAQQLLQGQTEQSKTFAFMLIGLAGISLLTGGIAISNVMLMSVSARRKEIGLRMALGARIQDIRRLFLYETAALTFAGAMLGALIGVIVSFLFVFYSGWSFSLAPLSIPLGIGSSIVAGLISGFYPAHKASQMEPVQALRDD
ncbi:macrolide export ATP-binding/permease protein MacB [Xenorhabdus mauleonii]|uniref:Macrolide export ATP-binding/permease protein MacB n=2 Tax=Xenorhabdus mauleonii TaxID=351675 RepID=A0A1I3S0H3_9GAMM|nr:macrolide export ATP-binding/permease protein MacB [Xenorhabdus mauleonii]SFJ51049.1 putative ABC transport system permease protein [Xenorhabdus mauleonii]